MYRKLRLIALSILYRIPATRAWAYARLPRHRSGYESHWLHEKGKGQRDTLEGRQSTSLQRFFPTPRALCRCLKRHEPRTVLDIGCGYGRFLEEVTKQFDAQGFDVAPDLIERVPDSLKDRVFVLDIVRPPEGWVDAHVAAWDVSYAWAVFMYFIDDTERMRAAMTNAERVTKDKVIVWDWKHVCDYMRRIHPSDRFEYHYLPVTMG